MSIVDNHTKCKYEILLRVYFKLQLLMCNSFEWYIRCSEKKISSITFAISGCSMSKYKPGNFNVKS